MVVLSRSRAERAPPGRRVVALAFVLLMSCAALPCGAQNAASEAEYQVKAAFLYKFLTFVEWPDPAFERQDSALVIGVLGADTLAQELSRIVATRAAHGRSVIVQRLREGDPAAGLHVLFVGRSSSHRLPQIVASTRGQPLLTIGESDDAFGGGSTINFVVVDDKVRFDVALHRAEQAGLRISARLLSVARKVLPGPS